MNGRTRCVRPAALPACLPAVLLAPRPVPPALPFRPLSPWSCPCPHPAGPGLRAGHERPARTHPVSAQRAGMRGTGASVSTIGAPVATCARACAPCPCPAPRLPGMCANPSLPPCSYVVASNAPTLSPPSSHPPTHPPHPQTPPAPLQLRHCQQRAARLRRVAPAGRAGGAGGGGGGFLGV